MNNRTILIVDDEEQIRRVLRTTLSGTGYGVIEAKNGEDAIKAVIRERPDLILLDVNMPGMSGLDLTKRLAAQGSTTPIVTITARSDSNLEAKVAAAGAVCLLRKPFDRSPCDRSPIRQPLQSQRPPCCRD